MIVDSFTKKAIRRALKEDIGSRDITTSAVLHKAKKAKFVITAKQESVISGLAIAETVFEMADTAIRFKPLVNDGMSVAQGKAIAYIDGYCRSILAAERTALNFLCWLSGISTLTRLFVKAVEGTKADIMDTRKTIPMFRYLQKYAVRMGGGLNHRMGLYDQVLIKDNHIASIMSVPSITRDKKLAIRSALETAKKSLPKGRKIEVEIDSLDMLKVALNFNPDIIMLDNMSLADIKEAVRIRDAYRFRRGDLGFNLLLEASGGVGLENVRSIAEAGVDRISIGALTHSAPAADISLEIRGQK